MQRNPQAKSQAAILVRELKAAGTPIKHQQALEMVAKMSGFRDWNAMATAPEVCEASTAASSSNGAAESNTLRKLMSLSRNLLNTCDETGCDGVTVAGKSEAEALDKFLDGIDTPVPSYSDMGSFDPKTQIAIIWSVYDVLSIRPDLTISEAMDVLQQCKRKHDAEVGITWDTLREIADWFFDERELTGTVEFIGEDGAECAMPAVVKLASRGRVYIEGKPLREFNPATNGDFKVNGLPNEDFPILNGCLFGNEDDCGDVPAAEIAELVDKLEKAKALPNVSKH